MKRPQFEKDEWMKEMDATDFRESGLLFYINQVLHVFGVAITFLPDTNELKAYYVRYRGFGEKQISDGYAKLSDYMTENAVELRKDCDE